MSDEAHEHCWHTTRAVVQEQVCCFCGWRRLGQIVALHSPEGHGPFFRSMWVYEVGKPYPPA